MIPIGFFGRMKLVSSKAKAELKQKPLIFIKKPHQSKYHRTARRGLWQNIDWSEELSNFLILKLFQKAMSRQEPRNLIVKM